MMSPEDTKKFEAMINNGQFTQFSFDKLLKRFELVGIDLEDEYTKVVKKESRLSRRQRDLISDFLTVRDMLAEKKKKDDETAAAGTTVQKPEMTAEVADKIIEEKAKNL